MVFLPALGRSSSVCAAVVVVGVHGGDSMVRVQALEDVLVQQHAMMRWQAGILLSVVQLS